MKEQKQQVSKSTQEAVAVYVNKTVAGEIEAKEVGIELLIKMASLHNKEFGRVPTAWQEAIDKARVSEELTVDEILEIDTQRLLAA